MVKNMWGYARGLKSLDMCPEARRPLKVTYLGSTASKGSSASKSVHKGLGAPKTSHILVYDFLGLLLPIFFIKNS